MQQLIAIREAYGEALVELGAQNRSIVVLDADVSNSTRSIGFMNAYPDRFFNFGIAEANMVSAAAGLASMGMIPFVNTFSFLLCERALDQIRSGAAYNNLNIKFAANYGGLSDSFDGASHHAISDLAIIRSIPNMSLIVISDAVCMKNAMEPIADHRGPVYFRLCRNETPVVHDECYDFKIGKGVLLKEGSDLAIIATGILLYRASQAVDILHGDGISARLIEIHTIKPIDREIIVRAAKETGAILTCEEANILGGLGSATAEVVSKECPVFMDYVGLGDCYAESGDYETLLDLYGMSVEKIVDKARRLVRKKHGR
jgi:transketolase